MTIGISVECVASEIGALGREKYAVDRKQLIAGLYRRVPTAKPFEAEWAINRGLQTGQLTAHNGMIMLAAAPEPAAPKFSFTVEDDAEFTALTIETWQQLWNCPVCNGTQVGRWWAHNLGNSIEECLSCGAAFAGWSW